jgi:hypothetical protein
MLPGPSHEIVYRGLISPEFILLVAVNCVRHMLESLVSKNQTLSTLATTYTGLLQEKLYTLIIQHTSILIWKSYCASV